MFNISMIRQKILERAMRGELVPQHEDDEHASVLLEKIKAEKQSMIEQKTIKKQNTFPPVDEGEALYKLPEGWVWLRLGEIGDWGSGSTPKRSNPKYYDGSILWLKTGELNDGYISDSEEKITDLALSECSLRLNKPGDVLIAMYGATIGKLGILEVEATTNQACCACTPFSQISNKFLFYYLKSLRTYFRKQGEGGAQPNISKEKIVNTVFPLPPYEEQIRIVEKIEELFAVCNQWESEVEFQQKHLEILRNKVLEDAMKGLLVVQDSNDEPASVLLEKIREERKQLIKEKKIKKDSPLPAIDEDEKPYELPNGWEWVRLGELGTSNIGLTYKPSNLVENGTPVLRANSIQDSKMNYSDLVYVNMDVDEKLLAKLGDLLICTRSGSQNLVGKCAIIDRDGMSFGAFMAIFRSEMNDYIHKFFVSKLLREQLFQSQTTTIFQITQKMLKNFIVPVPPLNEQKRIVEKIESIFETLDEIEKNIISPK